MDGERRLKTFLLGGLVGSAAGLAASSRVGLRAARRRRPVLGGLAAFEQAPCFRELADREAQAASHDGSAARP